MISLLGSWGTGLLVMIAGFWAVATMLGIRLTQWRRVTAGIALIIGSCLFMGMQPAWKVDAGWVGSLAYDGLVQNVESAWLLQIIKGLLMMTVLASLLIATDWLPLKLFVREAGVFEDASQDPSRSDRMATSAAQLKTRSRGAERVAPLKKLRPEPKTPPPEPKVVAAQPFVLDVEYPAPSTDPNAAETDETESPAGRPEVQVDAVEASFAGAMTETEDEDAQDPGTTTATAGTDPEAMVASDPQWSRFRRPLAAAADESPESERQRGDALEEPPAANVLRIDAGPAVFEDAGPSEPAMPDLERSDAHTVETEDEVTTASDRGGWDEDDEDGSEDWEYEDGESEADDDADDDADWEWEDDEEDDESNWEWADENEDVELAAGLEAGEPQQSAAAEVREPVAPAEARVEDADESDSNPGNDDRLSASGLPSAAADGDESLTGDDAQFASTDADPALMAEDVTSTVAGGEEAPLAESVSPAETGVDEAQNYENLTLASAEENGTRIGEDVTSATASGDESSSGDPVASTGTSFERVQVAEDLASIDAGEDDEVVTGDDDDWEWVEEPEDDDEGEWVEVEDDESADGFMEAEQPSIAAEESAAHDAAEAEFGDEDQEAAEDGDWEWVAADDADSGPGEADGTEDEAVEDGWEWVAEGDSDPALDASSVEDREWVEEDGESPALAETPPNAPLVDPGKRQDEARAVAPDAGGQGSDEAALNANTEEEPSLSTAAIETMEAIVAAVPENEREDFLRAVMVLTGTETISLSRLQRELGVTYYTASRIFEQLEKAEMISTYTGSLAREVLLDHDAWEIWLSQRTETQ